MFLIYSRQVVVSYFSTFEKPIRCANYRPRLCSREIIHTANDKEHSGHQNMNPLFKLKLYQKEKVLFIWLTWTARTNSKKKSQPLLEKHDSTKRILNGKTVGLSGHSTNQMAECEYAHTNSQHHSPMIHIFSLFYVLFVMLTVCYWIVVNLCVGCGRDLF